MWEKYDRKAQNNTGKKMYVPYVLIKMARLQPWYNVNDYGIEEHIKE